MLDRVACVVTALWFAYAVLALLWRKKDFVKKLRVKNIFKTRSLPNLIRKDSFYSRQLSLLLTVRQQLWLSIGLLN